MKQRTHGFTIVELLIVIVVIGILAGISIVAYSSISSNARKAALHSDMTNAVKKLSVYEVDNGDYPSSITSCPQPTAGALCITPSGTNQITYTRRAASTSAWRNIGQTGYELMFASSDKFLYRSNLLISGSREFVQILDAAPMIDRYGLVDYKISFDIKTASPTPGRTVNLYAQNGSATKYNIGSRSVPVTQEFVRYEATFRPTVSTAVKQRLG